MLRRHSRAICGLLAATALQAQPTSGVLAGNVLDPSGLPVSGATVVATAAATGWPSRMVTGPSGAFAFPALLPGLYTIRAARAGFRDAIQGPVKVRTGATARVDIPLKLGDVPQAVTVSADAPLLESGRGAIAFNLDRRTAAALPLDGRNFIPLIALAPGVTLPPGSTLPRMSGSRPRVSEYLYDGVSVLQPEPGQVAWFPVIDAIEEFRVETNSYSAEFGRANGGIIAVTQKSGSNEFHGTLFHFFRHEHLNARNLFTGSGAKPVFRRNQYGYAAGGPARRNRTFLFSDWQGTRLATGVIRVSTVPSVSEREGRFSEPVYDPATTSQTGAGWFRQAFPGNAIPRFRWDTKAASTLSGYPDPTAASPANNYRRIGNERVSQDQFDNRIDHAISTAHRAFVRHSLLRDFAQPVTPLPNGGGEIATGFLGDTRTRSHGLAAEHTWTPAADRVSQFRFGYTRRGFQRQSLGPSGSISSAYAIVGYQSLGPPANSNANFATSVTQLTGIFTWLRGGHTVKAGFDLRRQALDVFQPADPAGRYEFDSVATAALDPLGTPAPATGAGIASFLLGQVQRFRIDIQEDKLRPRARIAEWFLQDEIRATSRLTLNLGIRHTLNFPSTVVDNRAAIFSLQTQRLDFLGRDGFPSAARQLQLSNFGPRAGLALRASHNLAIRAGYGLIWIEQAGITTPFTTPLFPFVRTLEQASLDNIRAAFSLAAGPQLRIDPPGPDSGLGQGVFAVQRDQPSGYAQQWNLTVQRTLGANWSVEAAYAGSKLTNLGVPDVNLNQLRVEQLAAGPALTASVPNPYFGAIPPSSALGRATIARQQLLRPYPRFTTVALYRNNVGHSTWHAFQARLEKRFSRAFSATAAYTFSRLIDDAGAVFDAALLTGPAATFQAADSHNRRLEKDVSTGNIPHVLAASAVVELGHGWQLAAIARAQSGSPVAVTQVPNRNAFAGFGIQRPNILRNPSLTTPSTARWFDTSAFAAAPQFSIGSASRNPVTGPGYSTLDLMIGRTFALGETWKLEFRAEAFNLTNTPPLRNPNGQFGTPAFGSVTSALDPRVLETVVKLRF